MSVIRNICILMLGVLISACAVSPYEQSERKASYTRGTTQIQKVKQQIASGPVPMLYAGFALHNGSSAFQGDIQAGATMASHISRSGGQFLFSNAQPAGKIELPYATEFDLAFGVKTLSLLAEQIQKKQGRMPLLMLLLTSHGTTDKIIINADGENKTMSAAVLAQYLDSLNMPTVLIVSSCHSGSLIPILQRDHRIIMTATAADRVSFGCRPGAQNTWYIDALQKAFSSKITLQQWYKQSVDIVTKKEDAEGYPNSLPQLWIGKNMTAFAEVPLGRMVRVKWDSVAPQAQIDQKTIAPLPEKSKTEIPL